MWTAKRVLILVTGLFVALGSFAVYSAFLGVIDGLPPLPFDKLAAKETDRPFGPQDSPRGDADRMLELAFGPACQELQRPLRLWIPDKGIAFAAGEFNIDKDGRVRLSPFSAAIFHKSKIPGGFPEISTIRSDVAIFTLDRPVSSYSEMSNRKVIAGEMVGRAPMGITLNNNRRTAEKNDDVDVLISNAPLFYEERRDLIWTEGVVCLTDHQTKPPTVIRGKGMDMFLAKDSGPNRPRTLKTPPKNPNSDTGSIEKIHLRSDVEMHFWVEPGSGFLGGMPNTKKAPQPAALQADKQKPPEKAHIHIHTGGPFTYDMLKETAWFESPPTRAGKIGTGDSEDIFRGDQVHVERIQKLKGGEKIDQLTCDRLDLQFRRKLSSSPNPAGTEESKEIESARATCRDVNEVALALVSEGMDAFGSEMIYRAGDLVNGPLTILKGDANRPLRTGKDGHLMKCAELHLFAANNYGDGQKAWAKGPGQMDLLDSKSTAKEPSRPTHIFWRDSLTVTKDKEGGQVFDLMTVVGDASFIDDLQKQQLHGEKIMVWMLQVQESAHKPEAVGSTRQELRRVVSQDRVRALSPEFIVRRANRLTMTFLPEVPRNAFLPGAQETNVNKPAQGAVDPLMEPIDPLARPPENKTPVEEKKPGPPIELEANDITVAIATLGPKKEVQELIAKGKVHVFQPGEKPGEKALDITGSLLTVKHAEKGHAFVVYGEKDKLARVEVGDSTVWGPLVRVNQADNRAAVDGNGTMEMPTNKNIDGTETSKKNSRMRIDWKKNMTFDGQYAMFHGGVQAREIGAHSGALCEVLTVILDKRISFKQGQKDKETAKLDRLVFDRNVYIEDYKFDEKKEPLQYSKLQGRILYNREDGPTHVTGPGWVRLLAKGSADPSITGGQDTNPKLGPPRLEWKLTHVRFSLSMDSNTKTDSKKTTFYGENSGVEVFHFPTTNVDDKMDPLRPKKDEVYLRCEMLEIEGKQNAGRTAQTMIARRNVEFRTEQYQGYADVVKFEEATDIVIFEGLNGNPVLMYQITEGGRTPASVKSSKVLYNRKTGKLETEGVKSISN